MENLILERLESIRIRMKLDSAAATRHSEALETLDIATNGVHVGETLDINYKFCIEYFDQVAQKLTAIGVLCGDPAILVKVDCAELEQNQILVYDVFQKLGQVIRTVKNRED